MVTPSTIWTAWQPNLWLLVPFVALVALVVRGLLRPEPSDLAVPGWRRLAFGAGLLTLGLTVLSPADQLTRMLLTAHMIQYTLLTVVVPVLLLWGQSGALILRGLPRPLAQRLRRWAAGEDARRLWATLTRPATVGAVDLAVLVLWHVPGVFEAGLERPWLHALELTSFLVAGLLAWHLVREPSRDGRLRGYAATLAFLVGTSLIGMGFGLVLFNAGSLWYPIYESRTPVWGMRPLVDQQIAGVILGLGPESFDIVPFLMVVAGLLRAEEQLHPAPPPS